MIDPVTGVMIGNAVIGGIKALFGGRKSAAEKAQEKLAKQQAALAQEISGFSRRQHAMAEPALQKAMQYYMSLATGNRGQISAALAPQMNQLMEIYRGAERGLESQTSPGPQRDRALAEMYRAKAGQMGLMPFMARQGAMSNLQGMGMDRLNAAMQMYGAAGSALTGASNIYGNVAEGEGRRRAAWESFGQSMGDIFVPWILGRRSGGGSLPPHLGG